MKNLLILFVLALFSTTAFAQVKEMKRSMSDGNKNAFSLDIANADAKLIGDVWKQFVKDNYKGKTKYDRRAKEYKTDDIRMPSIGKGNTVDLHTTIEEKGTDATIYVWYNLGGAYLDSGDHPDRYEAAEKMLLRFGLEVEKEKVRIKITEEEKLLKTIEKDLKKLESDNDRYHKTIEKAKKEIQEAEDNIIKNLQEQELTKEKIQEQMEVVEKIKAELKKI